MTIWAEFAQGTFFQIVVDSSMYLTLCYEYRLVSAASRQMVLV